MTMTKENRDATRAHFVDIYRRSIHEAESGTMRPNNLASYVAWQNQVIADTLAGKYDHTFTFLQRAHWLETGECPALLT